VPPSIQPRPQPKILLEPFQRPVGGPDVCIPKRRFHRVWNQSADPITVFMVAAVMNDATGHIDALTRLDIEPGMFKWFEWYAWEDGATYAVAALFARYRLVFSGRTHVMVHAADDGERRDCGAGAQPRRDKGRLLGPRGVT
jgi:hypothetical protein